MTAPARWICGTILGHVRMRDVSGWYCSRCGAVLSRTDTEGDDRD